MTLAKAKLQEMDADGHPLGGSPQELVVQFNPETLKVSYTNQIAQGAHGTAGQQHVGAGATKLAVQLWFDVTAAGGEPGAAPHEDVRELTRQVVYFITPKPPPGAARGQTRGRRGREEVHVPPILGFVWGTFKFYGIVESLEESLEFFSAEGRPLRASVSLSISQSTIADVTDPHARVAPPGRGAPAGTAPLTPAPDRASVQSMTGRRNGNGDSSNWRDVASGNGIEDPLRLPPGTLLDLSAVARERA